MSVTNGFLTGRGFIDGIEGEGNLNEFFAVGHTGITPLFDGHLGNNV
jgi:hypothetical protein